MGACPVRVISFENYSIDTVGQQIKAVDMPDEFSEKPRILVMACENDAYPALDQAAMSGQESALGAHRPGTLPRLGLPFLGDRCDEQRLRRYRDDGLPAWRGLPVPLRARLDHGGRTHGQGRRHPVQMNLEPERVVVHEVAITDIERAPRLIKEMEEVVEKVGMSPFKF